MSLKEDIALEAAREGNFGPLFDLELEKETLRCYLKNGCQSEPYDDSYKNWTADQIGIAERLADLVGLLICARYWREEEMI